VIDHDGTADRLDDRDGVGQILDVDPELQVPAEFRRHRREGFRRVERHAAAVMQRAAAEEMVEAQPAHAARMPAPQLRRRRVGLGHGDAAQPVGMARQGVEHRRIVAPMGATLHQDAAGKAHRVEHPQIFFQRRIGRRVAAVVGIGKSRRRAEYMGMSVAGLRRRWNLRPRRFTRRRASGNHGVRRRHSAWMPAALMTGPHLS
jgi:hypothetical protein